MPFLTFADDTMIFAKATNYSCLIIRQILDKYCSMSGQLVNYHKSSFQCTANVSAEEKCRFAPILGMRETNDLGEYLSCPIISTRVSKETFSSVTFETSNQLPKCKANLLSQAGRAVLIQSNLSAKASYQMQSFLLPTSLLLNLDRIYRNFFWNKEIANKSPNLIDWDRICKSKSVGGLGFRKAKVNNRDLQNEIAWRIIKEDNNLWVKLVHKRYVKHNNILSIKASKSSSWQWKNLLSLRDLFKKGLWWQVGDGKSINFWFDNWLFQYPLQAIISPVPGTSNMSVRHCFSSSKCWDSQVLLP